MQGAGSMKKVDIQIGTGRRGNIEQIVNVNSASEVAVSPNGKEIAFIFRGEVFVTSVKEGTTKRITNTPEQERTLDFSLTEEQFFTPANATVLGTSTKVKLIARQKCTSSILPSLLKKCCLPVKRNVSTKLFTRRKRGGILRGTYCIESD